MKFEEDRITAVDNVIRVGFKSPSFKRFLKIYKEIRYRICLLDYPPGMTLNESTLAAEFNISRTPMRRVLNRLEFEGFVVTRHGVGTIVSEIDVKELGDVYALRGGLSCQIGLLNPVPPTKKSIRVMESILERVRKAGSNLENRAYWDFSRALQLELNKLTENSKFKEVSDQLFYLTNRNWQHLLSVHEMPPGMDWDEMVAGFIRELEGILQCMKAGDLIGVGNVRRNAIIHSFLLLKAQMCEQQIST